MGGRHSARAMQEAGRIYRSKGGGYCGKGTKAQRKLMKWTAEDWRTASGQKACKKSASGKYSTCDRYLPAKAWKELSPQARAATQRTKRRSRKQYVRNAPKARSAGQKARRQYSRKYNLGAPPKAKYIPWVVLGGLGLIGLAILFPPNRRKKVIKTVKEYVLDANAEAKIATLDSSFQNIARNIVGQARERGYNIVIVQAFRSFEEQDALYAQGRTEPGSIVTNARGGESGHNYGLAFDFAFVDDNGDVSWGESYPWADVGSIAKELGMVWGGDFKSFKDRPHIEHPEWKARRASV